MTDTTGGDRMSDTGATRAGDSTGGTGREVQPAPTGSATGAKVAAVGLWVVVGLGLLYGISQAVTTAAKLFG